MRLISVSDPFEATADAGNDATPVADVEHALRLANDGVQQLIGALDQLAPEIERAIEVILGIQGRLVVTGLGKSGHVGAKLAATFASTGTPAYFVHPSEASHGDLGMIRSDDAVLVLSWSGNTRELVDLTNYTRRFGIPLVAITSNPDGRIAKAADVRLILPNAREACPHNLAPTTSTLMQMALGDALATTVLKRRGFSQHSFHQFHPGGSLGASLTPVAEMAASGIDLPIVRTETPMIDVIGELTAKSLGIVGVCGVEGELLGVITDGDVRRFLGRNSELSIGEAMQASTAGALCTRDFVAFSPDTAAGIAIREMKDRKISAAFLVRDGMPTGCITMLQLLNRGLP